MKLFTCIILLTWVFQSFAQTEVYDLSIQDLQGKIVKLGKYKGQKILIASVTPDNLERGGLRFLDSLQQVYPRVAMIAVPAMDFGGAKNAEIMTNIRNENSKGLIIGSPANVKKNKGKDQNSLLKWLTNLSDNKHFNDDVDTDNQLYVISESGILYAVLLKDAPVAVIDIVLRQADIKE